jgi:hypothetical protein
VREVRRALQHRLLDAPARRRSTPDRPLRAAAAAGRGAQRGHGSMPSTRRRARGRTRGGPRWTSKTA